MKKDVLNKLKKNKIIYKKFSNHFKVNIKESIINITNNVINNIGKNIFYLRNNDKLPFQNIKLIKKIIKN